MGPGIHQEEVSLLQVRRPPREFRRHDLVDISEEGRRESAWQAWDAKGILKVSSWPSPSVRSHSKQVLEYGLQGVYLPGIIRRVIDRDMDSVRELYGEIIEDDFLAIGFVIPFTPESRRLRVPCVLHYEHVTRRITP
jgi:hypothetical protein